MQLAIVSPYPPAITGIGQYGYHITRQLARSNAFSRIVVLTGKSHGEEPDALPVHIDRLWLPNQVNVGSLIPARLKSFHPDVVWFNLGTSVFGRSPMANLSGFTSVVRTRQLGFPTLVTLHELPEFADLRSLKAPGGPFARLGARLLTEMAAQADVVCLTIRSNIDRLSSRRVAGNMIHIPMGAYQTPERLPESSNRELLFFTTLAPFKGLEVLLEAFQALKKEHPDLKLTIAGASHPRFPGYAEHLKQTYQQLEGIQWLGQVAEKDITSMFSRAQIVILPYNASTGASSVLAQAAALGRPVIASNLPETIISAQENGFDVAYFQRGNVAGLTETIRQYLASPQLRHRQAWHNFNAIQRSRPEETCKAYMRAFNLALEARRSPKRIALPAMPGEPA